MTEKFKCQFCNREYVRERTLINHMCEKKRRYFNRDEKYVILGFNAWKTFYILTGNNVKKHAYKDFMESNYYIAFTKFGKHIINTNMVNPEQFIPFVIKKHIRLDDWCKDSVYEEYVRTVCRREDIATALERQIKIMTEWAEENDEEWCDYFKKIEPGIAYKMIVTGRLSPWILLNSDSVEQYLFPRFSDEQFMHITEFINLDYWRVKMKQEEDDTLYIKQLLKEYEL